MQFAETEICELTESIWRSVLGLDLKRSGRTVKPNRRERFLTGCVQNILPAPSLLSLPAVTEGLDYSVSFPGGRLLSQIAFDCQGEPLLISIYQRSEPHSSDDGGTSEGGKLAIRLQRSEARSPDDARGRGGRRS